MFILFVKVVSYKFMNVHHHTNSKLKLLSSLPSRKDSINQIYNEDDNEKLNDVGQSLQYFREYVKRAINRFQNGDLENALKDMDRAKAMNTTQILPQRGIMLYINSNYSEAIIQLLNDISKFEEMKLYKASELRIWCSACYNKLNQSDNAIRILDLDHQCGIPTITQSILINNTLSFYAQTLSLEDLLEQIGQVDEKDIYGLRYYGNFYLGLYYDSINEPGLSQAFLMIPNESNRYDKRDMWYHVPRMLYKRRFLFDNNEVMKDSTNNNNNDNNNNNNNDSIDLNGKEWYEKQHVNSAGMIIN